ncbi:MAG: hypothetical protein DRO15_01950 [Thermoprotei archaeon]|nr:MAG: hypothetical protein DRO15_01950 [Thermoprotei archaeon]
MALFTPLLRQIRKPKLRKYLKRRKRRTLVIEEIEYPMHLYEELLIDEIDRECYILIELGVPAS